MFCLINPTLDMGQTISAFVIVINGKIRIVPLTVLSSVF